MAAYLKTIHDLGEMLWERIPRRQGLVSEDEIAAVFPCATRRPHTRFAAAASPIPISTFNGWSCCVKIRDPRCRRNRQPE